MLRRRGVGLTDHLLPFQASANVTWRPSPRDAIPAAMHACAAAQDTANRLVASLPLGLTGGSSVHLAPLQDSASVSWGPIGRCAPTTMQALAEVHDRACRVVPASWSGLASSRHLL